MKRKISLFLVFTLLFLLVGCSREAKFGVGEFFDRMEKDFETEINESDITLEKDDGKDRIYCTLDEYLLVLYLRNGQNISGVCMMIPKEKENELTVFINDFSKCVSILTSCPYEEVRKTMKDINISADKIKFADGNSINTVGKYKYSVIENEVSVTLFCERV